MTRIVVTGLGVISPIGNNINQFESALMMGKSGIEKNHFHNTAGFRSDQIGQVKGFEPSIPMTPYQKRHYSFVDLYSLAATHEALERAELKITDETAKRTGVLLGSGGAVAHTESYVSSAVQQEYRKPSLLLNCNPDTATSAVANYYSLHGPRTSIMTACSSGATAIGFAADLIHEGFADVMITGGVESLSYVTLSGFNSLQALSEETTRPFDKTRDGIVLGEGAGILILESYEHAQARGAAILGEFVSYGMTSDANHITAPHPEGLGMASAMQIALRDGHIKPEDITYINAHGTGTELNDKSETAAIKNVFGDHAYNICVSTIKPMIGHCLSAAGALEAIATVLALKGQFVPPTLNYTTPDPNCDLDYVPNIARNREMTYAMSNSLAFGGNNTSLIFKNTGMN